MNPKTRIVFTGDISFSRFFADGWKGEGCLSSEVQQYLADSDHVVANLECPLTQAAIESKRALNHSGDPEAGAFLRRMHIQTWSLANNHIMDCKENGLRDTLACAKANGCQTIGAGEDLNQAAAPVILGDAVKIGVLSIAQPWDFIQAGAKTPGALTWNKQETIKNQLNALRAEVDWIVLVIHGGDEYADLALPYMRSRYKKLLDSGADIIVAHHPHVVQNYELIGNKAVFYSLGNFIFDTENQRDFLHTDAGMLVGIDFRKDGFSFDFLPTWIDRENNKIRIGSTPPVFRTFKEEEYSKLWPFEAKKFYPVDFKKRKKLSKRMRSAPAIVVFAHEIYLCKNKRDLTIQIGRLKSLLKGWKNLPIKDVLDYLRE